MIERIFFPQTLQLLVAEVANGVCIVILVFQSGGFRGQEVAEEFEDFCGTRVSGAGLTFGLPLWETGGSAWHFRLVDAGVNGLD
jgi:hypothetical protein